MTMTLRPILPVILVLLATVSRVSCQDSLSLSPQASLSEFVAFGVANNPGLAADYQRYETALQRIPQVKALPDPKFTATHFFQSIETRTGSQETQLFVNQTIPWFGKLRLRGNVASQEAEAISHAYEGAVLKLAEEIGFAYYDYAYLGEATQITSSLIDLLEGLTDTVVTKVRGGGDLAPLLRLEVELAKNQDLLQTLQKQSLSKSAELRALLGMETSSTKPIPVPDLPKPVLNPQSRSGLVAAALQDNPELKELQSRIDGASEAMKLSKLSPVPDPTIGAVLFNTSSAMSPATVGSGDDPWGVQISFSIPLWSKKYKAEKLEAQAKYEMAKAMLTDRENALLSQIDAAFQKVAETQERLELYDTTLLPKARQALEVTQTSYKADRASILDLIDSERTLLEIERGYWQAVAEQYKSLIRLRTLTGKT